MKYPVFARDNTARDIKKRGIVDQVDIGSVKIGDVLVRKGDYIFGDIDGIAVIPAEIKDKIIEKSIKAAEIEDQIKRSINEGRSVKEITKRFGEF